MLVLGLGLALRPTDGGLGLDLGLGLRGPVLVLDTFGVLELLVSCHEYKFSSILILRRCCRPI